MEREVFGVVRPRERAQAADDELGGVGEAVEDDDADARGEQLQHGVARTRTRSRSKCMISPKAISPKATVTCKYLRAAVGAAAVDFFFKISQSSCRGG